MNDVAYLALDDELGAPALGFIEADPESLELCFFGKVSFLSDLEVLGQPAVDLFFGKDDGLTVLRGQTNHGGHVGGARAAVIGRIAADCGEILRLEAQVDPHSKTGNHEESDENEEALECLTAMFHSSRITEGVAGDKYPSRILGLALLSL